eukprot:49393-Prymnesium_polylepis.2
MYPTVRDLIIPEGLRLARAQREGLSVDTVPDVVYQFKTAAEARTSDARISPRAVLGWEWLNTSEEPAYPHPPHPPGGRINTHTRFEDESTEDGEDAETRKAARKAQRLAARQAEKRRAARKAERRAMKKAAKLAARKAERVAARQAARDEKRRARAARVVDVDADRCPPFELDEDAIHPDYAQL